MKGYKFYAWFCGLSLLLGCASAPVLAEGTFDKPAAAGSACEPDRDRGKPLSELFSSFHRDGESLRSESIDQLFEKIKTQAPKPLSTASAAAPPRAHTSSLIAHKQKAAHKGRRATLAKTPPACGSMPAVAAAAVHQVAQASGGSILAAAGACAGDATPVVQAALDRPGQRPAYKAGDRLVITLKANRDCNVLVFDFDNQGNLTQLFPNAYEKDGSLHAGQIVELGGEKSDYTLDIDGSGLERIFVYASPASSGPITLAMDPVPNTPFRAVNMKAEDFDKLVSESQTFPEFDERQAASGTSRTVHVSGKQGVAQPVDYAPAQTNNKVELDFKIDK